MKRAKFVLAAAAVLLLAGGRWAARAQTPFISITPEMDRWLGESMDDVFEMDFDQADAAARKVIALNPEHPSAYFTLAGSAWTRYVYGSEQSDPAFEQAYEEKISDLIARGEKWRKKYPQDPVGMMILGSAYGINSRLCVIRRQWLRAYLQGRKGLALTRAAVAADPNYYDAYLGLGMYDYYSDLYPNFIGVLAKLVLRGDRRLGIETLEMVAKKGHFSKSTAQIMLVEIYTEDPFGSRDPARAVAIMKELRVRYPRGAMMHASELVALYEAKRYAEVVAGAKKFLALVDEGRYPPLERAEGDVALGCGYWAAGDKEKAIEAFQEAAGIKYGGAPSRWAVWAQIRLGNLFDSLGRREEALAAYKRAAAEPDRWNFRRLALAGLAKPWSKDNPGPIPPHLSD